MWGIIALWLVAILRGVVALRLVSTLWLVSILRLVALVRSSVVSWLAVVTLRMIALITVVAALVVWLAFLLLRFVAPIPRAVLVLLGLVVSPLLARSLVLIVLV